jgi:biopolymer transport protein ExbB
MKQALLLTGILTVLALAVYAQPEPTNAAPGTSVTNVAPETSATNALLAGAQDEITTGEAFLLKLKQGGITMIFLLLTSVAGLGYALERAINLRRKAIVPAGLADEADRLWRAEQWRELEQLPEHSNSTLANAIAVVARHRRNSMAEVSMLASDICTRDLKRQLQAAYPLAVVATVAPLLGLFGTVVGMIGAFDKVAAAGALGDASLLGGDISKALITTGAGLAIAVPALALYHYFKSRTSMYAIMLEEEMGELISAWFAPPVREEDARAH